MCMRGESYARARAIPKDIIPLKILYSYMVFFKILRQSHAERNRRSAEIDFRPQYKRKLLQKVFWWHFGTLETFCAKVQFLGFLVLWGHYVLQTRFWKLARPKSMLKHLGFPIIIVLPIVRLGDTATKIWLSNF